MEQPLGRYVGNALEVRQALEILNGVETAPDYLECTLILGGWMLKLSGSAKSAEQGAEMMRARIADRSGLKIFREIVKAQNGDVRVVDEPDRLVSAKRSRNITAARDGYVTKLDARKIGHAGVLIAAGRAYKEQKLDYGAGLILEKKVGDRVRKGETLAVLRAADEARLNAGEKEYREALEIGSKAPRRASVVIQVLK
jgi:pyrimidine-nucleoside phosphorylase